MMGTSLLQGIIFILLLYICKSQVAVTSRAPFPAEINLPSTVITTMEPKMSDLSMVKPDSVEDLMKREPVEMESVEGDTEKAEGDPGQGIAAMADEVAPLGEDKNNGDDQADDGIERMVGAAGQEDGENEAGGDSEVADRVGAQDVRVEDSENYGEETGEVVGPDVEVEFGDREEVDEEVRDGVPGDIFAGKDSNESETETRDLTAAPLDTYVPPHSHGAITRKSHPESNAVGGDIGEDMNNFNEVMTPNSELLNLEHTQTMPALDDSLEDEDGDFSHEQLEDITDGSALGIETWKIGTISAAIFLFLEAAVILIYCLKYRKRISRRAVSNLEAGRTVKRETNELVANPGDGNAHQTTFCEMSQRKKEVDSL